MEQIRKPYILRYREASVRKGTERWAQRDVASVQEAKDWMNANQDIAWTPAHVKTRAWKENIVALLHTRNGP